MNAEEVNREIAEKPICPECGADARRPKCLFELGSYCPRHDALAEWKLKQAALAGERRNMDNYLKGIVEPHGDYAPHERRNDMGERMYLLTALGYPLKDVDGAITESEMKTRIDWIRLQEGLTYDNYINRLLHGEGEEGEGFIYEDALPEDMTDVEYDVWYAKSRVIDGVRMGPPFKPSPPQAGRSGESGLMICHVI